MARFQFVIEPAEHEFQQHVIERSRELPVVVDFWSPRCGPCLALAPVLEKAAQEAEGKFLLAKVNCDEAPALAGAFGVSSIPAVFALRDGKVVDYFLGNIGEAGVRHWLQGILPSQAEQLAAQARQLAASDMAAAEAKLREAVNLEPQSARWQIELARLQLQQGHLEQCRATLDQLSARGFLEEEAQDVQAALTLRTAAAQSTSAACRAALAKQPGDRKLQLQLARVLAGEGHYDEALDVCLAVVQQDRHGAGDEAKELMKLIFRVLGPDDERTSAYRRKLASALY